MEALQRNLEVLRARNPELSARLDSPVTLELVASETARSGAPTMRIGGRLEASAEDPEAEGRQHAERFLARAREVRAARLVVFGLGVHTLRYLTPFQGPCLVVEPSLALCRAVLSSVDLSEALERVDLVVTDSASAVIANPIFSSGDRGLLLFHPTARRRAPGLWDHLRLRFHSGGTPERLRIAVVPPLYGGSLPVAHACARALREIGHEVVDIDLAPFSAAHRMIRELAGLISAGRLEGLARGLTRLVGEVVRAVLDEREPDVLFALAQAPLDVETLEQIRRSGIPTALWFCEDFRVMTYWRALAPHYDTVFHVQPGDFDEPLREAGAYGVPLSMAFDPSVHQPVELTAEQKERYGADVTFVGAGYRNRVRFLAALLDQGLRIFGTEWPPGPPLDRAMPEPNVRQSPEDSNLIFNAARINLNLHSSPWCDGVNPAGDYLNPRTFELAGARRFQLVDERRDLTRHFSPGTEVETFRDAEECRKKIAYYLAHDDERVEIAAGAYRRALSEHTYRHRMEEAVAALRTGSTPAVPRRRRHSTVGEILESAREEPDLASVLSRIPGETRWSSAALSAAIAKGEGPLTQEEKLLLFVREYEHEIRMHHLRKAAR